MTWFGKEFIVEFEIPTQNHKITARTRAKNCDDARRVIERAHPGCTVITSYPVMPDANYRKAKNPKETY